MFGISVKHGGHQYFGIAHDSFLWLQSCILLSAAGSMEELSLWWVCALLHPTQSLSQILFIFAITVWFNSFGFIDALIEISGRFSCHRTCDHGSPPSPECSYSPIHAFHNRLSLQSIPLLLLIQRVVIGMVTAGLFRWCPWQSPKQWEGLNSPETLWSIHPLCSTQCCSPVCK